MLLLPAAAARATPPAAPSADQVKCWSAEFTPSEQQRIRELLASSSLSDGEKQSLIRQLQDFHEESRFDSKTALASIAPAVLAGGLLGMPAGIAAGMWQGVLNFLHFGSRFVQHAGPKAVALFAGISVGAGGALYMFLRERDRRLVMARSSFVATVIVPMESRASSAIRRSTQGIEPDRAAPGRELQSPAGVETAIGVAQPRPTGAPRNDPDDSPMADLINTTGP
jgi:hypothetical protein